MANWNELIAEVLDEQTRLCDAGRKEAADALQPKLRELLEQRRQELNKHDNDTNNIRAH